MSAEATHFYRIDRLHEDAGAEVDARDAAIAAKIDAFHQHGGIWAAGRFYTLDDAYEAVWVQPEYVAWWKRKEATEGREQETVGKEYKPMLDRLLAKAITVIATLAVIDDQEAA